MSDLAFSFFMLLIVWAAQLYLCLRDYFRERRENLSKPPLTEDEKAARALLEAELFPIKERKGALWYLTHPKDGLWFLLRCAAYAGFGALFLPMVLCVWLLPPLQRR
jgi:hypothetical protein